MVARLAGTQAYRNLLHLRAQGLGLGLRPLFEHIVLSIGLVVPPTW